MSFNNLGLRAELVRAVSEKGYSTPTPIQTQAIPLILEGRDLMGSPAFIATTGVSQAATKWSSRDSCTGSNANPGTCSTGC
jgi:ATP-dependent RNA helicase RhlE